MKNVTWLASLALGAAITLGAASAQAEKVLVLGCSLPLSGPEVGFGQPIRQGMELAVDQFNASKQLPGATIKLDCKDSQDQPQQTVNIAQGFVDDPQVIAALSDFSTTATMAAASTYGNAKLVDMTPTASSLEITQANPYMFRSSETIPDYIEPLADFSAKTLGKKKIAIVHVQTDWGQNVAKNFSARMAADGGKIVADDAYNPGTTDFRSELTKLRRLGPDEIFLAMLEQDAVVFMEQRHEFGMDAITVVDSGVGLTARSLGLAGAAFNGLWADRLYNPHSTLPQVQDFIKAFTAKYGKAPDEWSADGYDGAMVLMLAAKRAGPNVTRETEHEQVINTGTYIGADGPLTIDPKTHELSRSGMTIVRVENGHIDYAPKY